MSAASSLQGVLVQELSGIGQLSGVFDGPPARAPFPYVVVDCGSEKDWSCVGRTGREVLVEITLWDDRPSRLLELEEVIDGRLAAVKLSEPWQAAAFAFIGKSRSQDPAKPRSSQIQYCAQIISSDPGGIE